MNNEKIYLSLGSNLGDSLEYLWRAIDALHKKGVILKTLSGVYQTAAVGYTEQADFLNMVVGGETKLSPLETLNVCQGIENNLARVRTMRWGPRTIDLDLLLFGERQINTEQLQIPHPRMQERAFVLIPLQEIAPVVVKQLQVIIPEQRIKLLITAEDVKMILKKRGLDIDKG